MIQKSEFGGRSKKSHMKKTQFVQTADKKAFEMNYLEKGKR